MKYLTTHRRRQFTFIVFTAFLFLFAARPLATAQEVQRKFKPGDQIKRGTKIYEIVECRLRPGTRLEECDYLVIHEDGSEGSLLTEPVFDLRRYVQENEAEKKRQDAINRRRPGNQTKPPAEKTPAETPEETVPPTEVPDEAVELTVTALQFNNDYSNNEIAAMKKYVDKIVRVTGAIVYVIHSNGIGLKPTKAYLGSAIQCQIEDTEQLESLNTSETITIVGMPRGGRLSTGVSFLPCRIERKTAGQPTKLETVKKPATTAGNTNGKAVGTWYYTTIINVDGAERKLTNSESYLWLKEDGSYENRFGPTGQIGNYAAGVSRLTLNREDGDKKVYTMTLSGNTMTLKNSSGGYRLERE